MKTLFFVLVTLLLPLGADAGSCHLAGEAAVRVIENRKVDPSLRSAAGTCAIRNELGDEAVAAAILHVIQDRSDDLFLREDLVEAFGETRLRRRVKVEENLAPPVEKEDLAALKATLGRGAEKLLTMAQSVKSMDETQVVCPREADFVRALSQIVRDPQSHIILRETAVAALEKNVKQMLGSKLYDERSLRLAQDSLAQVAGSEDSASFFSGAADAYNRLAEAGLPYFTPGRALASAPHQ